MNIGSNKPGMLQLHPARAGLGREGEDPIINKLNELSNSADKTGKWGGNSWVSPPLPALGKLFYLPISS